MDNLSKFITTFFLLMMSGQPVGVDSSFNDVASGSNEIGPRNFGIVLLWDCLAPWVLVKHRLVLSDI